MKRRDLTKILMIHWWYILMISNKKNLWSPWFIHNYFSLYALNQHWADISGHIECRSFPRISVTARRVPSEGAQALVFCWSTADCTLDHLWRRWTSIGPALGEMSRAPAWYTLGPRIITSHTHNVRHLNMFTSPRFRAWDISARRYLNDRAKKSSLRPGWLRSRTCRSFTCSDLRVRVVCVRENARGFIATLAMAAGVFSVDSVPCSQIGIPGSAQEVANISMQRLFIWKLFQGCAAWRFSACSSTWINSRIIVDADRVPM